MRVRWFGEPWPSADERAPVCEDDRHRVATPVSQVCIGCGEAITDGDRGVVMAANAGVEHAYRDGWLYRAAEHIDCLVRDTLGPDFPSPIARRP